MGQLSLPLADPLPGYRFNVFLNELVLGFQKVTGISREIETEVYREGGLNTMVHVFPKCCSAERVLRMERGAYGGVSHPFCTVGERLEGNLNLMVLDGLGSPVKKYLFMGLLAKRWEVGELSAEQNILLIDCFEVCYEDFEVLK